MQSVAQSWLVLELTGSPLQPRAHQHAPVHADAPLLGLLGRRRRPPARSGACSSLTKSRARGAVARPRRARRGSATCSTGTSPRLALCSGSSTRWTTPRASPSSPSSCPEADVGNAVALSSAGFNSARIVGPGDRPASSSPASGSRPRSCSTGSSFVFVIAALAARARAPGPVARRRAPRPCWRRCARGCATRCARRASASPSACCSWSACSSSTSTCTCPSSPATVLHQEADGFGFLMASLGVGAVAGALALGAFGARAPVVPVTLAACRPRVRGHLPLSRVHAVLGGRARAVRHRLLLGGGDGELQHHAPAHARPTRSAAG